MGGWGALQSEANNDNQASLVKQASARRVDRRGSVRAEKQMQRGHRLRAGKKTRGAGG